MKSSKNINIYWVIIMLGHGSWRQEGVEIGPAGGTWILAPWGKRTLRGEGGDKAQEFVKMGPKMELLGNFFLYILM